MCPSIWYSSYLSESNNNDCDCDCDCDCACAGQTNLSGASFVGDTGWRNGSLIVPKGLIQIHLKNDYVSILNPNGTCRMVVFDPPAFQVFNNLFKNKSKGFGSKDVLSEQQEKLINKLFKIGFFNRVGTGEDFSLPNKRMLTAWISITNKCNLDCLYCYVPKSVGSNLDFKIGTNIIDAIFRSALINNYNKVKIKYSGGEASLNLKLVGFLHDYLLQKSAVTGIEIQEVLLTNGVFLPEVEIDNLKQNNIGVMVSLDGIGQYHDDQRPMFSKDKGSFSQVLSTLNLLQDKNLTPFISITVTKLNVLGLTNLVEFLLARELPFGFNFYRKPLSVQTNEEDLSAHNEILITELRKVFEIIRNKLPRANYLGTLLDRTNINYPHEHSCGVGNNYIVFDQNGQTYPCHMKMTDSMKFANCYSLDVLDDIKKSFEDNFFRKHSACHTCAWLSICAGGCPVMSKHKDLMPPHCEVYKVLLPEIVELKSLQLLAYTKSLAL
ncbi:MAG: radical SAM protein [Bacteroidales bacterium]|nr:radical SAM protein [Bacteroidales bacterium]